MGASCCESKEPALAKMAIEQKRVLWIVLTINLAMFGVEFFSGLIANSTALLGDSLDMLGDSFAYGASLYVVGQSVAAKVWSARFKGFIILFSSILVLGMTVYRTLFQEVPGFEVMGTIGALALAANVFCLILLTRHRRSDVNMSSVWLCSRNDIIANLSVLVAAYFVKATGSPWPDLLVGGALAILFVRSAIYIFSESNRVLNSSRLAGVNIGDGL